VGFTDSFFSGVGDFFTGALGFVDQFSQTRIGGELLDFGLGEFADLIGLKPSVPSGRGVPLGPLGSPIPGASNLQLAEFCRVNPGVLVPGTTTRCPAPGPTRGSLTVPRFDQFPPAPVPQRFAGPPRPQFGLPPIPSSSPFGARPDQLGPGAFGPGSINPMVAFPTFLNASFSPSPRDFTTAGFPLAPLLRQLPSFLGGAIGGAGVGALLETTPSSTPMFRPTMAGVRAQTFRATNPVTGKDVFFRPAGKPVLWSSDIACAKRVDKIARRVRRKR